MTTFESLELVYDQFMNLSDEIKKMIEAEEFTEALDKLQDKNRLIQKLINARKTIVVTEENKAKLEALDKQIMEKDEKNLEFSTLIHKNLGDKLKSTHKKVKVNSAYSINTGSKSGIYLNLTE